MSRPDTMLCLVQGTVYKPDLSYIKLYYNHRVIFSGMRAAHEIIFDARDIYQTQEM